MASSAEFGGDLANVEGAPASQRAADPAVFKLDEQRRGLDRIDSVAFVERPSATDEEVCVGRG